MLTFVAPALLSGMFAGLASLVAKLAMAGRETLEICEGLEMHLRRESIVYSLECPAVCNNYSIRPHIKNKLSLSASDFCPASKILYFFIPKMCSKSSKLSFPMTVIACGGTLRPLTRSTILH